MKWARRILWLGVAAVLFFAARPTYHLLRTIAFDNAHLSPLPKGTIDDASRLNQTKVAEVWQIPVDKENPETQIADLLRRAKAQHRKVSIAGARHSMGGHSFYPGGIVIDTLPLNRMTLDAKRRILTVQAGARWSDIIPFLDKHGFSVQVMQSNDNFTVGGSISVNCHGWQYNRPPIASTVESIRLMLADGSVHRCSRTENPELFSLALGGYGLFGIILEADLRVVPNERYRLEQYVVPVNESIATFQSKLQNRAGLEMFYARLNIVPAHLFDDVIIYGFIKDPGPLPALTAPTMTAIKRAIFRGSALSDYGKELRFSAETEQQAWLNGKTFSRNQLLFVDADWFANHTADTTDILQEYFVPRARATEFLNAMRGVLRRHRPNLLNVTVRLVNADPDTYLRYADKPIIAFVMLFVQEKTPKAEDNMRQLTRDLIDAALEQGGRYYLPYRLHATPEQFHKAYPNARTFFELKRKYDPDELFQNNFYAQYGKS
jgi:FAD/FMN-containing dehydrogenase